MIIINISAFVLVVYPLELETRLYYLSITITTDTSTAHMGCGRKISWNQWKLQCCRNFTWETFFNETIRNIISTK